MPKSASNQVPKVIELPSMTANFCQNIKRKSTRTIRSLPETHPIIGYIEYPPRKITISESCPDMYPSYLGEKTKTFKLFNLLA